MNPSAPSSSLLFSILFLLGGALATTPTLAPQGPTVEIGVPGTVAPQSADVRLADTLANQDSQGGTNQVLISLAASPGAGFAAVWRDQRDGMLGLYLARLTADGELLEPEHPIHQPHSGRRLDPTVALNKENAGAVVWVSAAGGTIVPWVRTFGPRGQWLSPDRPLMPLEEVGSRHPGRESGARLPVVAALPHGGYAVAWTQSGQVKYQELEYDGAPHGKTYRLAPSSPPAEAGVHMAVSNRGSVLCVWRTQAGNMAINHGRSDTAPVNCGAGVLCRLITDPVGGFWGAFLIDGQAVLRHLSVDGKPDRPEVRPITSAVTGLDLALGDDYLVLLAETAAVPRGEARGERGRGGEAGPGAARNPGGERGAAGDPNPDGERKAGGDPLAGGGERGAGGERAAGGDQAAAGERASGGERAGGGDRAASGQPGTGVERSGAGDGSANSFAIYLLERDGRARDASQIVRVPLAAAVAVRGPRLVSNGKRVFVAWTDQRNGDQDIYGRLFEPGAARTATAGESDPRLGAERRVNTDTASSDQNNPRIAGAGNFAVLAWQDSRDGANRVYARLMGTRGFTSDEFRLPVPFGDASPAAEPAVGIQPAVAIQAEGPFAVQWKEMRGKAGALRVQCFGADKQPIGAPVSVEDGQDIPGHAIVALGQDRGYLIAWFRGGRGGLWTRRLSFDGKLTAPAQVAEAKEGELGDLALALLDDQRSILAWDVHGAGEAWSLRGRFLDAEGVPKGDEIAFEPSPRKVDWQPCLAPGANNGFVLGWCSGGPADPGRDIVARVYDARGKPAGPLLPISCSAHEQDFATIARLSDKSYVVAFEDDISYYDHTYVRRILPGGRELGAIVRLNELETKAVEDRTAPQIAVLGDGFVGAWNDRRRSQGWDIYARILGPKFDDVKPR